jgi:hypothetical protein
MYSNLYIFEEELDQIQFKHFYTDSPSVIAAMVPRLHKGNALFKADAVYIAKAGDLPAIPEFFGHPSIICIGTPPECYLSEPFNIIYTEEYVPIITLLEMVMDIFNRYSQWQDSMQEVIDGRRSIKELGLLSLTFASNPIYLQGAGFKCLFSVFSRPNEYSSELYKHYCQKYDLKDNSSLSLDRISSQLSSKNYIDTMSIETPFIYNSTDSEFNYHTMIYNLRVDGSCIARLSISEVLKEFTDRDYAIIQIIGCYILKGISSRDIKKYNRPQDLDFVMENLLKHQFILEHRIASVLKGLEWNCFDRFFCLALKLRSREQSKSTLEALALQLTIDMPSECYYIFEEKIVYVFNLTRTGFTRQQIVKSIIPVMRKNALIAGISVEYDDFKDMYYYYQQACAALNLGMKEPAEGVCYKYEDYNLKNLIMKCSSKQIARALYPQGLIKLMDYDKQKDSDNVQLLRAYLKNNLSITHTINEVYMHRNTFLYRIEKIREITGMDFNNSDTRLELMIAFKIMDLEE